LSPLLLRVCAPRTHPELFCLNNITTIAALRAIRPQEFEPCHAEEAFAGRLDTQWLLLRVLSVFLRFEWRQRSNGRNVVETEESLGGLRSATPQQ